MTNTYVQILRSLAAPLDIKIYIYIQLRKESISTFLVFENVDICKIVYDSFNTVNHSFCDTKSLNELPNFGTKLSYNTHLEGGVL